MVLIFRNQVDYRLISVIWKVSLILGRELQRTCMFPTFHPSLPLLGAFKTNCFCFLLPLEFLIEHGMCFYDLIFHCGCWVVSLKLNKLMWGLSFLFNFFCYCAWGSLLPLETVFVQLWLIWCCWWCTVFVISCVSDHLTLPVDWPYTY